MSNSSGEPSSRSSVNSVATSAARSIQIRNKRLAVGVVLLVVSALAVVEIYLPRFSVGNLVDSSRDEKIDSIAVVVQTNADVRQKPGGIDEWFKAETNGDVVKGDSIYSGANSSAEVKMNSGAEIAIQDEVLVIFDGDNQISIPDQARGIVRLQLDPGAKLSFSGQVSQVAGTEGTLTPGLAVLTVQRGVARISAPDGGFRKFERGEKIELKIKTSETKVLNRAAISSASLSKSRGKSIVQKPNTLNVPAPLAATNPTPSVPSTANLPDAATVPEVIPPADPVPNVVPSPVPVVAKPPTINSAEATHHHVYLLREMYQRKGKQLLEPRSFPNQVRAHLNLAWADTADRQPGQDAVIQVSNSKDFAKPWLEAVSKTSSIDHSSWPVGENYWRVSYDKVNWSQPGKVLLSADFDNDRRPTIIARKTELALPFVKSAGRKNKPARVSANLEFQGSGNVPSLAWVLQAADSKDFNPLSTKAILVTGRKIGIPLKRTGKFYFRVQAVNKEGQLSGYSATKVISVVAPKVPKTDPVVLRRIAALEEETRREAALKAESLRQEAALKVGIAASGRSNERRIAASGRSNKSRVLAPRGLGEESG